MGTYPCAVPECDRAPIADPPRQALPGPRRTPRPGTTAPTSLGGSSRRDGLPAIGSGPIVEQWKQDDDETTVEIRKVVQSPEGGGAAVLLLRILLDDSLAYKRRRAASVLLSRRDTRRRAEGPRRAEAPPRPDGAEDHHRRGRGAARRSHRERVEALRRGLLHQATDAPPARIGYRIGWYAAARPPPTRREGARPGDRGMKLLCAAGVGFGHRRGDHFRPRLPVVVAAVPQGAPSPRLHRILHCLPRRGDGREARDHGRGMDVEHLVEGPPGPREGEGTARTVPRV